MEKTEKGIKEVEKELFRVFYSEKKRVKRWLAWKLQSIKVELKYAVNIAKFEKADNELLKLNGDLINKIMKKIVKEYKDYRFDEKIAFNSPGRLRKFKKHKLPINSNTIKFKATTLIKNRKMLEENDIIVNSATIIRNPDSLIKTKKFLEKRGHPVTIKALISSVYT